MIEKLISIWIKDKLQLSIHILLLFLLVCTWTLPDSSFALLISNPKITMAVLCRVTLSLLLITLAVISSLFILLKKPNIKHYEHINPPGFYKHKKTGNYYCQKCLLKDHIAVPLSPLTTDDFHCRLCGQSYKIDYNVLICHSYLSIAAKKADPLFENHEKAVNEFIHKNKKC